MVGIVFVINGNKGPTTTAYTTVQNYTTTSNTNTTTIANSTTTTGTRGGTPVVMTDPAQVPAHTSAAVVSYSSLMVHSASSGWTQANGTGTVNLMAIQNASSGTVIGNANISSGAKIDMIKFAVTKANITVNGTTYNVSIPNSTITANVNGNVSTSSNSSIVVDITPTITATYSHNATTFVMTSSSKVIVASNTGASSQSSVGSSVSLNANAQASLNAATPSIVITNATVSTQGNVTTVHVTVKDNSSRSVALNNVVLYGPQAVNANSSASIGLGIGGLGLNISAGAIAKVVANIQAFNMVGFSTTSSGSLSQTTQASTSSSGYTISPGSTATLTYTGKLTYDSALLQAKTKPGSAYNVVVTGQSGATAFGRGTHAKDC